ncbi:MULTISPECIES: AtpZ/AtpI family protein [unclassified Cellulophaga]|uniref:AtpZ/AtpI family protein n=1 Tax=unclassified Cellulophaga TaxID=2634405 RepID=UPI001E28A3C9|nr:MULTISPECIES: AtpZ/AtpI family protein [unclassified Cellulophaga]MDO6489788.1 AtpZ/AtpI family protein [Cellulophaga sp. 2_MG-2023]MDO6495018.1 AtpZ/AtpI family protein [Cellulophaga sp. 3_MG-2023]
MELPKLPNKNKPNHLKNAAMLSGIAFQMGAIIYLAHKAGVWLDAHYNINNEIFTVIATLSGVAISIFAVVTQLKKIKF